VTVGGVEDEEEEDQEWLMVKRLHSYEDQEQLMVKRLPGQEDQDELGPRMPRQKQGGWWKKE
jgi:hypothetical protein